MIKFCEKAPFGKGFDTVHNENVRRTWQIKNTAGISFRNPKWNQGLSCLKEEIATQFNCGHVPILMSLYKLLVYEEGGHFQKHKDTEKEDGMFATLVIQLPSEHEGGDLVVYKSDGTKVVHDFGKGTGMSSFACHYAVHYADAEHEITAVTKGLRVALVYSICWPKNAPTSPPSQAELSGICQQTAAAIEKCYPSCFFLSLSHEYTEKSVTELGSACFKGIDRCRSSLMLEASQSLPESMQYRFYIVKMTAEKGFYDGDGNTYEEPSDYTNWKIYGEERMLKWYQLEGSVIVESSYYSRKSYEEFLLSVYLNPDGHSLKDFWGDGKISMEGYTGNEGPSKTTTYSRFGIVAVPVSEHMKFASEAGLPAEVAIVGRENDPEAAKKCVTAAVKYNCLTSSKTADVIISLVLRHDGDLVNHLPVLLKNMSQCVTPETLLKMVRSKHYGVVKEVLPVFLKSHSTRALISAISQLSPREEADRGLELMQAIVAHFSDPKRDQELVDFLPMEEVLAFLLEVDSEAKVLSDFCSLALRDGNPSEMLMLMRKMSLALKQKVVFKSVLHNRIEQIQMLVDAFSDLSVVDWRMPEATFPYLDAQRFLRGPEQTFVLEDVGEPSDARLIVKQNRNPDPKKASYKLKVGKIEDDFEPVFTVEIAKTTNFAIETNKNISKLRGELAYLMEEMAQVEADLKSLESGAIMNVD